MNAQSQSAAAALASPDPTGSTTLRAEYVRHLNGRWREVFGVVRQALENDRSLHPTAGASDAAKIGEIDYLLERIIDTRVIKPLRPKWVTRGRHYSASYVRRAYKHGLKLADGSLNAIGIDVTSDDLALDQQYDRVIRRDPHAERLQRYYRQAYDKIAKAGHLAHEDAAETFAERVDEAAPIAETISDPRTTTDGVNDRLRKMGKSATKLSALGIIVEVINVASVERYGEAGIAEVTAEVEVPTEFEAERAGRQNHTHTHGESPTDTAVSSTAGSDPQPAHRLNAGERDLSNLRQIFSTAGDDLVCDLCASLAGRVYTVEELRQGGGMMPVRNTHQGCRCRFLPFDNSGEF